jgi:DNA invertase Pin-like site-specific DNA recombinase
MEAQSGKHAHSRPRLQTLLSMLQPGDTFLATRLDRIGRSMKDLANIVHDLSERKVTLKCTEQTFDTSTSIGKAMVGMLATFAEFELNIRKERQLEGIRKEQRAGKYKGRPPTIDVAKVMALAKEGRSPTEIADELGISRASVYRVCVGANQ